MAKKKVYAVAKGRRPGIYHEWYGPHGAEVQIRGYQGAFFRGFPSLHEAQTWLEGSRGEVKPKSPSSRRQDRSPSSGAPMTQGDGSILIYTDGGCIHNPGPGGYGVVIIQGDERKELSGGFRLTTNNRMELTACIVALNAVAENTPIVLHSDSKYVVDGITKGWAKRWRAKGWMRTDSEPALNADLWDELLALAEDHDVQFKWIKGHVGIKENERCDELAKKAMSRMRLPKDRGYET